VSPGDKGWSYFGRRYCIQDTSTWSADAPGFGQGKWYTRIGNIEYQSDDLEDCERPLYEFAEPKNLVA
jgi:hypothetical protein